MTMATVLELAVEPTTDLGVDRANNVIRGAKVIQLGRVNDSRPFDVDEQTLEQVIEFGNRPNKGLKARYRHPRQGESLGSHLGFWTNFRRDGDAVRADLTLAKSSFATPYGNLGGYVMELADEAPESFGLSLATLLDKAMFDSDSNGLRFAKVKAVDVVGEPAATRGGLFDTLSQEVATMADQNTATQAEAPEAVTEQPEADLQEQEQAESLQEEQGAELTLQEQSQPFIEAFAEQGAAWFLDGKSLLECYQLKCTELSAQVDGACKVQAHLEAKLEAALLAAGADGDLEASTEPQVGLSETVKANQARAQELQEQGADPVVARFSAGLPK